MEQMPIDYYGFYTLLEPFISGYYEIGERERAREIWQQVAQKYQENLTFYSGFSQNNQYNYAEEIITDIERYRSLVDILIIYQDEELIRPEAEKFNNYLRLFRHFYGEEEELNPDEAKKLATYQDIAITQEGLLATYKVADLVTWQYEMVLDEKSNTFEKKLNQKYLPIPDKIDPVTGELIEKGGFEKPDHLEDYQFTPAICKNGDKFFSGDKIGYVYEVGKIQFLPNVDPGMPLL